MEPTSQNSCPTCQHASKKVDAETVYNMVISEKKRVVRPEVTYYLCMNPTCSTSYFSHKAHTELMVDDVKVPLWYKEGVSQPLACYCNKVTRADVERAVREQGARSVKEVCDITDAMKHSHCKENNPLGVCCHGIIQQIIDETFGSNAL